MLGLIAGFIFAIVGSVFLVGGLAVSNAAATLGMRKTESVFGVLVTIGAAIFTTGILVIFGVGIFLFARFVSAGI